MGHADSFSVPISIGAPTADCCCSESTARLLSSRGRVVNGYVVPVGQALRSGQATSTTRHPCTSGLVVRSESTEADVHYGLVYEAVDRGDA